MFSVVFIRTLFLSYQGLCMTSVQDALRLYLINSPVVRAETLRFKKEGVFNVVSISMNRFWI
jgi:hypothetical protein